MSIVVVINVYFLQGNVMGMSKINISLHAYTARLNYLIKL